MLASLWVAEPLCEAKVDHVDIVLLFADPNQEIVRLDVPVQEVPGMHELDSLQLYALKRNVLTIWSASMSTVFSENLRLQ